MKTYDIYFSDGHLSDNKGFSIKTPEKAIHMAEDMLAKGNAYIDDYAGGVISVVSSDDETVWSAPIPQKGQAGGGARYVQLKPKALCSQE